MDRLDPDLEALARMDQSADELDDRLDREELRRRYYGLLQELRVLLPGVQVLVAFLLTAPFASRFGELDQVERATFGLATISGILSVTAFVTPTALHRVGGRTARSSRLQWSIRLTVVGLAFLALALLAALFVVARFVYGPWIAAALVSTAALAMAVCWLALPLSLRDRGAR